MQSEMATDADIPLPVCEARGEQVGNFVDNIVKISVSEVPLEKQNQDDKYNELPIVEGENFFKSPLTDEVHCEANNVAPNVSKVVKKTFTKESQQNAEESNSKDGDEDGGVVPKKYSTDSSVVTSEMKVGDTTNDPCTNDAIAVTQLSKETSSDHHGTCDSSTENVALTKEILLESNLLSEEAESHTPCISEGGELKVQSKTTDDKSADEKPTEEDMSSNLTNEMTSDQEALKNERSVEENFNTAAEKASHERSTSGETITILETSNSDKLQNKSNLNTSLSKEESQQNAEESNSIDEDADRGVVPGKCSMDSSVVTSELKVGDTTDDPCTDNAMEEPHISKEKSSTRHGTCDSSTKNVALTKEILLESSHPSKENESHTPCISEGEELNAQSKTIDNKFADEKPPEEDLSSNPTNEMTSDQEPLENERSVEDNFNADVEKASHENNTPQEAITTIETSNGDKLESKTDLNTPLSKEEETAVQKGDRAVTTSEDHGVTSEKTLSKSHGDVECQSKTLKDAATDHNAPKLAEKSEESSPVQVEDSQVERDEHFEEESERLPLTEVSTRDPDDNVVPEATDIVKDKDNDLKEAELSENEKSTSNLVEEGMHKENPAESFYVAPENIEVSDLSKENSVKAPPEEQSRNEALHGDTNKAEEATINVDDGQKESLESIPPIVSSSHEEDSMNAVLQEATSDHTDGKTSDKVDNHKEVLENLSSGVGHCEVTSISPDVSQDTEKTDQTVKDGSDTLVDRPVELAATEETSAKEIQRNAEEFNSTDKDGGRDVIPEVCSMDSSVATSEIKVGDTLDPDMDDEEVATLLSKDTSRDHHGTNDSSTTDVAFTEEILQEADLLSKETESHTRCISEGEEPNVQVKTMDNKSEDEKPTEEDISCNITNEVSKEGESDHNKITREQEELENERSAESSTSGETIIALETSITDELQSKSDLNSSLSKEEETALQNSVELVTTPEDYGVPSEKTLRESHGDVECQSKTMEDAATDHSDPKLSEKSEESSVVQVEDSQIDHNEHLEEEREGLLLTEVSKGGTNDNISAATGEVKEQDEDHKEAELSESEQSTKCTLVKEDVQIENPAESLHVVLENIEVSNISQGNNIEVLPEEQSSKNTNANLHGNTIKAEEATIDAAEGQKDSHESFPPIVSGSPEEGSVNTVLPEVTSDDTDNKIMDEFDKHEEVSENLSTTVSTEDAEGISLVKLEGSENKKEDDSGKESEGTHLPLPLARKVSDSSMFLQEARFEDGEPKKAEFSDDERDTESMLPKTEPRTENTEDVHVKSEDTKAPDSVDKRSEGGTVDAAAEKEETVENVPTVVPNENTEENLCIQAEGQETENEEHLDKENEQVSSIKEPSGAELFETDKHTESVLLIEEVQSEKLVESLHASLKDIKTSDFDQYTKAIVILGEQIPAENSQGVLSDEAEETRIDAATTNEKTQELQNVLNENSDKDLLIKVAASEMTHDINLEEEPETTSLTEISKEEARETESILLEPKINVSTVELPKYEKTTDYTTPKKESLQPEDHKTSTPQEDDSPNEGNSEATLIKEDVSIELPQIEAHDREEPCLSEVIETNSQEEQILHASPGVCINKNEENKTIDPTTVENETPKDEVPKEMESVDVKGETKEEEGYLKAVEMITAVVVASNQDRSLNLTAEETSCAEDLNVDKDVIGHIPEVSNYKEQDSSVMNMSEEHIVTSNKHVSDSTSMESEVLEKINNQIVGEANSCGGKMDLEKIEVLNDDPTAIPISETLAEIDSRGCTETEVQLPNREKEAEVFKREAENDQKSINETLPNYAASEDVSELKEVNGEEEISFNNSKQISSSPISVASEEVSTSNVALEEDSTSNSVTDLQTKNEEEALAIKETTPSSVEGQDAESTSVEENSNYVCSLTEKKSDSFEVAFTPGENKSGYESNNRGLESIAQGQSFDIISETEETKAEEEDLKAESQPGKAVTEDILQEETMCEKEIVKVDVPSEKEQLPRIKEEHEDVKDYHQGSCEEEVIKDSHQEDEIKQDQHINNKETYELTKIGNDTETVPEVSEEAGDKAPEDLEEKIFANEAIDRILHQEGQVTSIEEPTTKIDDENDRDLDIACVNTDAQNSNKETVQIATIPGGESEEQNKEDEICSSDEVKEIDEENLILSEGKSKEEAKETYKEAYVEAEKFDLSPQTKDISECAVSDVVQDTPEDNENSKIEQFSEEDYPKKITECEVSSAGEDIALTEPPNEDAAITADVQEAKAGIDLGAAVPVPEATGLQSQEVEELKDTCTEVADASTPVETSVISSSKKMGECTEGTPLEAKDQQTKDIAVTEQPSEDACITAEVQEAKAGINLGAAVSVPEATGSESQEVKELNDKCTEMADTPAPVEISVISTSENIGESTEGTPLEDEDQQTKLHDKESNMRDAEVKMAEKYDAVNLQSVRDINEDVQDQELCEESFGASNHNSVEGDPEERTETSEGQETNPIQAAPVSETLKQEIEEQKLGRDTVDVHEEEKNRYNIPNQLESVDGAETEKVPESSIHQSFVEDTAQHEKKEGIQQIDSPLFLPHAKCSDIKTSENEPAHVGGLGSTDVTELEASPLSLKDKHVVLEADDTRNLIPENLDGDKNMSTEHSQGEHEVVKPSKVEQEEEECGNEERKDQKMEGKTESEETDKPSLSDLLQVSTRGTSEMADHSPTEKEPTSHTEGMHDENIDETEHENRKTDEEKDDEEESHEQIKSDLGSEAPVMVDIGDADMKVAHKKSHNILSGVGSKMKHSIAKVKKAITGKSPSPKKVTTPESK